MTAPARFDPSALGLRLRGRDPAFAPKLVFEAGDAAVPPAPRRTRIWELSTHLHCSVVGTCLSTGELRQVLSKAGVACDDASDHDLHGRGVLLAAQHDRAAKLLHKALDKRHRLAVNRFERAKTADEVRALWREAASRGDIPGGYWAVLTHRATTDALIRDVFGEVHMLSHLVGAANRADIRRLGALEAENAALQEKLGRQQDRLRDGITSRDARIRELGALLSRQIADRASQQGEDDGAERAALTKVVADLERRLEAEMRRRTVFEKRLERSVDELRREREQRIAAERREHVLGKELEAVEASLARVDHAEDAPADSPSRLDGLALLYVGGRPGPLAHLRALSAQLGADFLHHDGGVEDRSGLLAGLVSRADVVMFPVDCVSHEAVLTVKRLCRQAAKPYVPLRSAGISSFVAALGATEVGSAARGERAPSPV